MSERYSCFARYAGQNQMLQKYHDEEWGVPCHDEQKLIEMFILELFQAGLSWAILLKKRENFRKAFDGFQIEKIAAYDKTKIDACMQDEGIIRNRRKLEAMVNNARGILLLQKEYGSFSNYLWSYTDHQPILCNPSLTRNELSDDMAEDLKKRGFRFAGSVTLYSFLQAVGIIYSHPEECWRYQADEAWKFSENKYRKVCYNNKK